MEKRKIQQQEVSLLGMGCMRLPKKDNDEIDIEETQKIIDYAYQNGITYYDTAYPYHDGKSEIVIGNALKKYPRDSFLLADKLPIWKCNTLEDVKSIFQEQLKKCQVEYFDFYLCHAMNLERFNVYKKLEVFPYLIELRKQGYIRHLGFSFHDSAQNIIPIADELDWDFAQIQFNYLDYTMQDAKKQYEELTSRGIAVVVMEPIRGGLLANVCKEAQDVFHNRLPNASSASWALRYVANFPNIKVILSGMSTMPQLEDNVNTFKHYKPLDDADMKCIEEAKQKILGNDFIPCTGCRYCVPCPFGVNIPKIFSVFNMYSIHKDIIKFKDDLQKLDATTLPAVCKRCGKCVRQCPQHIAIFDELEKINKRL